MSKKPGATQAMHKVIMVGSGGVGKSALTLQFMYDEVKTYVLLAISLKKNFFFLNFNPDVKISLLKIMNLQKQIPTEKKLY